MDLIRITDWEDPEAKETPLLGRVYGTWLTGWLWWLVFVPWVINSIFIYAGPQRFADTLALLFGGFGLSMAQCVAAVSQEAANRRRLLLYLKNRMDMPGEMAQYGVEVTYSKWGLPYGTDIGVVTLRQGVIDFVGRHSHFSIPTMPRPGFSGMSPVNVNRSFSKIHQRAYRAKVDIRFHSKMSKSQDEPYKHWVINFQFFNEFSLSRSDPDGLNPLFLVPPEYPNAESLKMRRSRLMSALLIALLIPVVTEIAASFFSPASIGAGLAGLLIGTGVIVWQWGLLRILSSWFDSHRQARSLDTVVPPTPPLQEHNEEQEVRT